MDPGEFSRTVRVFLPFHVQLVSNMKKEIQSPIVDKQDLKAKAIAAKHKAASGELIVVAAIELPAIKTADFQKFLTAVKADGKAVVVTPEKNDTIVKSARNIPGVLTTPANNLSVYDIINAPPLFNCDQRGCSIFATQGQNQQTLAEGLVTGAMRGCG